MMFQRSVICVAFLAMQALAVPAIAASAPPTLKRATAWACKFQGERQGLHVRQTGKIEAVTGADGRVIGGQTTLRVSRRGQYYDVRCNYTTEDKIARITAIADARMS